MSTVLSVTTAQKVPVHTPDDFPDQSIDHCHTFSVHPSYISNTGFPRNQIDRLSDRQRHYTSPTNHDPSQLKERPNHFFRETKEKSEISQSRFQDEGLGSSYDPLASVPREEISGQQPGRGSRWMFDAILHPVQKCTMLAGSAAVNATSVDVGT